MTHLYKVNINWWDEYQDEEKDEACLIFASGISEVGTKLEENFKYINEVKIEEICCDVQDGVLWLPPFPLGNLSDIIEANTY